jgi:hypothetical protein
MYLLFRTVFFAGGMSISQANAANCSVSDIIPQRVSAPGTPWSVDLEKITLVVGGVSYGGEEGRAYKVVGMILVLKTCVIWHGERRDRR